jgi:hypothetical protein
MAEYWHQVCERPDEGGHSSNVIARRSGYPGALAQGNMVLCWMGEYLRQHFGERWYQGGALDVKIVARGIEADILTFHATRSRELGSNNASETVLDVWCQNQRGGLTMIGTARAPVN